MSRENILLEMLEKIKELSDLLEEEGDLLNDATGVRRCLEQLHRLLGD